MTVEEFRRFLADVPGDWSVIVVSDRFVPVDVTRDRIGRGAGIFAIDGRAR